MEGCGEAQPPRIPLFPPAVAGRPGATPAVLPPLAGNDRLVEGLWSFEQFIRYAGLVVGLKPSATECEARLRGLERMMYSKTIWPATSPCRKATA